MYDDIYFVAKKVRGTQRYFVKLPRSTRPKELIETTETVYWILKSFQREDWRQERAARRYVQALSLTDDELNDKYGIYGTSPEEQLYQNVITHSLRRAFMELPPAQARRFLLHHGLGLTYRQVADVEGCSVNSVKQSIRLAKPNLKKILKKNKF